MIVNGNYIFTVRDAIGLAEHASKSDALNQQYLEAVKGDYILPSKELVNNEERKANGTHLQDGSDSSTGLAGLAAGKLPGHPTFSRESPYAIRGLSSADGGEWNKTSKGWEYSPSQSQFDRDPAYKMKLLEYYEREKGNGIDSIKLPDKKVVK